MIGLLKYYYKIKDEAALYQLATSVVPGSYLLRIFRLVIDTNKIRIRYG